MSGFLAEWEAERKAFEISPLDVGENVGGVIPLDSSVVGLLLAIEEIPANSKKSSWVDHGHGRGRERIDSEKEGIVKR